ncbi:PaaI family thioesterase [Nocardioides sp. URHA0032]|uniref:PaaI family thioesterase n=1 Tax=Nocardioides sp. URHA0032 TaxID=1380388 RepID=UPI000562D994|nr:PaaI family thioesterase [Nocardioides sp. URHA0032]
MAGYVRDEITDDELDRQKELYVPFTEAVRALVDATIRTEVDDDEVRAVQAEVEALTERLRRRQLAGAYGVRFSSNGRGRPWGNPVVGIRNPAAPPVLVERDPAGKAWASFHLGAAFEGPPGLVHGGVSAMVLDQLLGEATGAGGKPGMTGTLTLRYRRGTPLGDLRAEAWIERSEGIKTWARGHLMDADGVTVEAEGLFILPRWARERTEPENPRYFE